MSSSEIRHSRSRVKIQDAEIVAKAASRHEYYLTSISSAISLIGGKVSTSIDESLIEPVLEMDGIKRIGFQLIAQHIDNLIATPIKHQKEELNLVQLISEGTPQAKVELFIVAEHTFRERELKNLNFPYFVLFYQVRKAVKESSGFALSHPSLMELSDLLRAKLGFGGEEIAASKVGLSLQRNSSLDEKFSMQKALNQSFEQQL